jgi:predicted MFS family arabinose efflux permease
MTDGNRPTRGWRAAFAATLALSMGIGPFAVNAIGALSPMVVPDLGLTRTELGTLATLTFAVAAATTVVGGRQTDRFPGRTMLVWVFLTGGAAAAVVAGATSLAWLWLGAVLGGISQAIANPVTNQLIADHVPAGTQGVQIGVKQSGVQMAQAVIGLGLPSLAVVVGWRPALLVGPVFMLLGLLAVRQVIPGGGAAPPANRSAPRTPLGPTVWWLTAYIFTNGVTAQMVLVYVPLYSFERVGLSAAVAGTTAGTIGATGIVARILWTRMAERLTRPWRALTLLSMLAAVAGLLILAAEYVGAGALWPGLILFGASAFAVNGVVMLIVIRTAGDGRTGRATGVVALGLFLGFMTGPVTLGAIVDRTDSYTIGWTVVVLLSLLATVITLLWARSLRTSPSVSR